MLPSCFRPSFRLHRTYSLAGTNRSHKREKDSVPDYERLGRMGGRMVEAILFCAGQGRRMMTCELSSLHLPVHRSGGRVDGDEVLTLAHLSEVQPVVTKQDTIDVSMEESKQNSTCTAVPARKGSGTTKTCRISWCEITPGT